MVARRNPRWSAVVTILRFRRMALSLASIVLAGSATFSLAQEPVYDVDQVKAAFLYHFGTYVQWPNDPPDTDPITIVVLGDDDVAAQLAEFLPGRRIQGRAVEVRPIRRIEELGDEELLFIGSAHNAQLEQLIASIGSRPILAVSDAEDGLDRGAMVNFRLSDSRVRFEVSLPRVQGAGLSVSSRLLSAALRVETAP